MERSLWDGTFRFHRLVLRDGARSSHLLSEKQMPTERMGFTHATWLCGCTRAQNPSQEATWKLVKQKGLQECYPCFPSELSKGREVGMSEDCISNVS